MVAEDIEDLWNLDNKLKVEEMAGTLVGKAVAVKALVAVECIVDLSNLDNKLVVAGLVVKAGTVEVMVEDIEDLSSLDNIQASEMAAEAGFQ